MAFINVEPYKLQFTEGRLQPVLDANNQLQPVDAVNQWKPAVRAVDLHGGLERDRPRLVRGRVGTDELQAAIAAIAGRERLHRGPDPAAVRPARASSSR